MGQINVTHEKGSIMSDIAMFAKFSTVLNYFNLQQPLLLGEPLYILLLIIIVNITVNWMKTGSKILTTCCHNVELQLAYLPFR